MLHGWLNLDKPEGISSAQAVGKVKKIVAGGTWYVETEAFHVPRPTFRAFKIGHAGTLDPLASGVLLLALGEATKTVAYAMNKAKTYRFRLMFGERRSTGDAAGEVIATSDNRPSRLEVKAIIPQFIGEIWQTPPVYSAIHVDGKRAYALARAGEAVELAPRRIRIDALELLDAQENYADFEVSCGKGTYIRALAEDIARALGTEGYTAMLIREQVGNFWRERAISLAKLEEVVHKGGLATWLHPVESVLDDIPAWEVTPPEARRLTLGNPLIGLPDASLPQALIRVMEGKRLVAIAKFQDNAIHPVRVFNYGA